MRPEVEIARGTPGPSRASGRPPVLLHNTVGLLAGQVDLSDVQAIVKTDFKRLSECAFLLLKIGDRRPAAWLKWIVAKVSFAADSPTSAAVNVAFAHSGLESVGLEEAALAQFPEPFHPDPSTIGRRAHRLGDEGDSAPFKWRWGNDGKRIDAIVLVYADEPDTLDASLAEHRKRATDDGIEVVETIRAASFKPPFKEPFGFVDGISQPPVDRVDPGSGDERPLATGEFLLGYPNEGGVYPPSPSVTPDDATEAAGLQGAWSDSRRDFGRNGTYLVFRQLDQDVLAFWDTAQGQSKTKAATGTIEKWGARMIGRWPSGAPLVLCPQADDPTAGARNDFGYRSLDDDRGFACPAGAHIRRTNPRDSLPRTDAYRSLTVVRQHRIIRRSRPYGTPLDGWPDPDEMVRRRDSSRERGICFICLNADLGRQFEFIQERWMNDPTFVTAKSGERDPLVGNPGPDATFTVPAEPVPVSVGRPGAPLARFVTVRGSGYFFVPSRRALAYLALLAGRA